MLSWLSSLVGLKPRLKQEQSKSLKEEKEEEWLQTAAESTVKLYHRVKVAVSKSKGKNNGKVNEPNQRGQTLLDEIAFATYYDNEKFLARNMLDDIIALGATTLVGDSLNLVDFARHQSLSFIARLFAIGVAKRSLTSRTSTFQSAFEAYFDYSLSRMSGGREPLRWNMSGELQDFHDGIALFCRQGGRPHRNWIFLIDRIVMGREEKDAKLIDVNFSDNMDLYAWELEHLAEKSTCMGICRFILEQDAHQDAHENASVAYNLVSGVEVEVKGSWLQKCEECVQQGRYDLCNLLIEYGHINPSDKADIKQLRQNPHLMPGFTKLLERRNNYLEQLKSISSPNASESLFEVSVLLSLIVDCI